MIYADVAATAPLRKTALEAMLPWLGQEGYGNASGMYSLAREARRAVEKARSVIAGCIGAKPEEIYFTSGGTESDNWAIQGAMRKKGHIITTAIEHHAVLHTVRYLTRQGCEAAWLPTDEEGRIRSEAPRDELRPDTALVSIMWANNEIGVIMPVNEMFALVKEKRPDVLCHTDAVQAVGHIPVSLEHVDLLSMAAHKFGGPKGIGALYIRKGVSIGPLLHGGGHERGKRSGTENVAGIVGMAAALQEATADMEKSITETTRLRNRLIDGILQIPYSRLNGPREDRLPGNASFLFECVEGESLVLGMDAQGICVSSGSACSSGSLEPSHVLMAIGLPQEVAHGNVRFSIDDSLTGVDIDTIIEAMGQVVARRRAMSPLWNEKEQCPTERFWK